MLIRLIREEADTLKNLIFFTCHSITKTLQKYDWAKIEHLYHCAFLFVFFDESLICSTCLRWLRVIL